MSAKNILAFAQKIYHTLEQYRKCLLRFLMLSYVLLTVAAIYWLRPRYIGKQFYCFANKCLLYDFNFQEEQRNHHFFR
jgi:hypothetical protein